MTERIISLGFLFCLVACGGGSSTSNNTNDGSTQVNPRRVNWQAVSSDFHPEVQNINFRTDGAEKINLDVFGFSDDVEVVYVDGVPQNSGVLKTFSVYKKSASWGSLTPKISGKSVDLKSYGTYACSIRTTNGQITELEGGCYIRLQIFLPKGSEIEVYNVGNLISRRFIPITSEIFLENLNRATWDNDKLNTIDEYLGSYSGLSRRPSLTTNQLATVVHGFIRGEFKLQALSKLHSIVSDRDKLAAMIENEFSYFDRQEAHRIVGL